jgi:putative chitinase
MQVNNLRGHIPDSVIAQLSSIGALTNSMRVAHFLAQCSHESGGFKRTVENLNYSANGLLKTFPKYFTQTNFVSYARDPERIGNRVYANRMGNRDEASGDGYKFRGRGFIQLTGHDNYAAFGMSIGEDCINNPDLVATHYTLASAGWFFTKNNIWKACDSGINYVSIAAVTKKVNGGTNGLIERTALFNLYWGLLNA